MFHQDGELIKVIHLQGGHNYKMVLQGVEETRKSIQATIQNDFMWHFGTGFSSGLGGAGS